MLAAESRRVQLGLAETARCMADQTALAVDLGSTGDALAGTEANVSGSRQGRKVRGYLADFLCCERSRKGCHHRQADRIVEQGP